MLLSKEFNYIFPLDEMIEEWKESYKEDTGEPPGRADINDFYNYWYGIYYDQMYYNIIETMQRFLIWNVSYNEIYDAWRIYWKDRE